MPHRKAEGELSPEAAGIGFRVAIGAEDMADGIWLLKLPGSACPDWVRRQYLRP